MGIKFPTPWNTLIIKFPPPRDGKSVKCPGYARGGGACWSFDLTGSNVGGKTRNIAIQLVWQLYCKTSCTFFGTFRKMSKIFVRVMSNFILVDQKDNSSGNENVSIVLFFFFFFSFWRRRRGEGVVGIICYFFVCLFRYLLPSHITVYLQELVIHLQERDEGIYWKANIAWNLFKNT